MTMPIQDTNAQRPIGSDVRRPAACPDLPAINLPPHQPRAVMPNRVFRGG